MGSGCVSVHALVRLDGGRSRPAVRVRLVLRHDAGLHLRCRHRSDHARVAPRRRAARDWAPPRRPRRTRAVPLFTRRRRRCGHRGGPCLRWSAHARLSTRWRAHAVCARSDERWEPRSGRSRDGPGHDRCLRPPRHDACPKLPHGDVVRWELRDGAGAGFRFDRGSARRRDHAQRSHAPNLRRPDGRRGLRRDRHGVICRRRARDVVEFVGDLDLGSGEAAGRRSRSGRASAWRRTSPRP